MNAKTYAPALKPLDHPQRLIPVTWHRQTAPVACRVTQPGYYLIGLRMRMQHIQRQGRLTYRVP